MVDPLIIVGLGNPGSKYTRTRHNAGFMVTDELAHRLGPIGWNSKWAGQISDTLHTTGQEVVLIKPQTFMNLSGQTVQPALKFYKSRLDRVLVIYDEIELAFGDIRLKEGGGHKGHNGLRDLKSRLHSGDFWRLRFGVGRSTNPNVSVADHVLGPFTGAERPLLPGLTRQACDEIENWIGSRA